MSASRPSPSAPDALSRLMFVELGRYNRWQNEKLYAACAELGDEVLERDLELFFGSIVATLDHILLVDRVIVDFIESGEPPSGFEPLHRLHEDFASLRAAREAFDRDLEALFVDAPDGWLAETIGFEAEAVGGERRFPRAFMATQLFNHQTHHRSQVTSVLHRLGVDYGNTDLPWNPISQF